EDASEGESTEEDNENKEPASRCLGLSLNEAIEEDGGIELQEVTVHRTSADVDRSINFNLSRPQEENMHGSCGRLSLHDPQSVTSLHRDEKSLSKGSDDEGLARRKASRSDSANSENKTSLDENGNPIMGMSSSSSLMTSDRPKTSTALRTNGHGAPQKEISRFDRLKAKIDKKKPPCV
ncbi:hypothetical protein SK128_002692, partial [Halocaridina rubra]